MQQQMHWQETTRISTGALQALEIAWRGWGKDGQLPSRALFDPMDFPELLPWMLLGEITAPVAGPRRYDVMFRYLGSEFERYFKASSLTRAHLSSVGAPYTERWFAVYDQVMRRQQPHYFTGAPFGTGYEYLPLEMLALPLAKTDAPEIGFVLCAFARLEVV
jgi:hypothetical protein